MSGKCLEGVRVLDLSRLLPGPFGTAILSDLGAMVLKVEGPADADLTRAMPGFSQVINRGKKGITLNLKTALGKEIFFQLVERSEVLVEQFRPGVMDRLGVGFEACKKHNPKLVFASLSGYGATGPYAEKAGHDLNYLSLAGVAGISGTDAGELAIPGVQIADLTGGLYLVIGVLAGLQSVSRNQQAVRIDVSMFESCLSLVSMHLGEFFLAGQDPGPSTMQLNGALPNYQLYQTGDGRWMSLGALEGKFWGNFCRKAGKSEWEIRLLGSKEEREKLKADLKNLFRSKSFQEWQELARDPDLCLEPAWKFSEIENDPQVRARGLVQKVRTRDGKEYKLIRSPVRFPDLKVPEPVPAPAKGEHTEEILLSLGYRESDLERFKKEGVI